MIKIGNPYLYHEGDKCYCAARISDEVQGIDETIWFSTPEKYGQYFCADVSDAFVVMSLLPAIRTGQDIMVETRMSERLYFHISTSVLAIFKMMFGKADDRDIKVICKELTHQNFGGEEVGCGCSLGVDSLSAIFGGVDENCPDDYRITMLTNFNVGAYSDVFDKAHASFENALVRVGKFADMLCLPLLTVESNMGFLFGGYNFNQCVITRIFSTVLSLQKLFRKYSYAACSSFEYFSFDSKAIEHCVQILAPLLSTESTEIFVSDGGKSRVRKIELIADSPLSKRFLDVCWRDFLINKYGNEAYYNSGKLNCSRCDKCKRTMMALDLLGKLEEYSDVFNLYYWKKSRTRYIGHVLSLRNKDPFMNELWNLMKEKNFKIPMLSRIYAFLRDCRYLFTK